jgi:hypothetical protein
MQRQQYGISFQWVEDRVYSGWGNRTIRTYSPSYYLLREVKFSRLYLAIMATFCIITRQLTAVIRAESLHIL